MEILKKIYWLRAVLGIVAAFASLGYATLIGLVSEKGLFSLNTLLNGLSIACIVYIISYYILKHIFIRQVEKPQKIFTTGIGIYFISWLVFWVLLYTIAYTMIAGAPQ